MTLVREHSQPTGAKYHNSSPVILASFLFLCFLKADPNGCCTEGTVCPISFIRDKLVRGCLLFLARALSLSLLLALVLRFVLCASWLLAVSTRPASNPRFDLPTRPHVVPVPRHTTTYRWVGIHGATLMHEDVREMHTVVAIPSLGTIHLGNLAHFTSACESRLHGPSRHVTQQLSAFSILQMVS